MISFHTWNKHSRLLLTVARLGLICYQCPLLLHPIFLAPGLCSVCSFSLWNNPFSLCIWRLLPEKGSPHHPKPSIPPCFIFLLAPRINCSDLLHLFLYLFIICFIHVARINSMCVCLVTQPCPTLCDTMGYSPPNSSVHGDSPGKNSALLHGIFPTQGLNPGLPHWATSIQISKYIVWVFSLLWWEDP